MTAAKRGEDNALPTIQKSGPSMTTSAFVGTDVKLIGKGRDTNPTSELITF